MTNPKLVAAALTALCAVSSCTSVSAQSIRDDFKDPIPSTNWYVCNRPENKFAFGVKEGDRSEFVATVSPLTTAQGLLEETHTGCRADDTVYKGDGYERAELWESDSIWKPMGTDIWYRFDMFVDNSITPTTERYVIGQWKEHGSPKDSPIVAQRFTGRIFETTIEQDNTAPGHKPADDLCRIVIASQNGASAAPWPHGSQDTVLPPASPGSDTTKLMSFSHSFSLPSPTDNPQMGTNIGCARNVKVQRFNSLPDPFWKWTTMVYHLHLATHGDSLIEIWADGKKISLTTGLIGFVGSKSNAKQYFKFGSYRNAAAFETTTKMSRYIRSELRSDIDPDGSLTPN